MSNKRRKETIKVRKVKRLLKKIKNGIMCTLMFVNVLAFFYVALFLSDKKEQVGVYILVTALCYLSYKAIGKLEHALIRKLYQQKADIKLRHEYHITR